MNLSQSRILVTGASGFLGSWLVEELISQRAFIVALVRDYEHQSLFYYNKLQTKTTVVSGDLLDFNCLLRILNEYDIDSVFHLGAQPIVGIANRSPLSTFKSNIEGTWNLLEACRLSSWVRKIIIASSDKAYGDQPMVPYQETMSLQGKHPYDVSKSCADLLAQSYFHSFKLPICVTRCGNFFGGGDFHFNRIVPGTIKSIVEKKNPIIRSNGMFVRDYIYIQDVVHAYLTLWKAMDNEEILGETFNFSTDQPFSVIELVNIILQIADAAHLQPIVENNTSNEIMNQHLSSEKARNLLDWKPNFGVQEGLIQTFKWYSSFLRNMSV